MKVSILIALLHVECIIASVEMQLSGKKGYFDRLDSRCWDGKAHTIIFKVIGINIENGIYAINYTYNVLKDIETDISYRIEIERCRSRESPDTCESFYVFQTKKFCNILSNKNSNWNAFFVYLKPEFTCPIKKGLYTAIGAVFELKAIPVFPVSGFWWRLNTTMSDPDTGYIYFCSVAETTVNFIKNSKYIR